MNAQKMTSGINQKLLYFWDKSETVIKDQWNTDRVEFEKQLKNIQIQVNSEGLAKEACQKWVNNLNN